MSYESYIPGLQELQRKCALFTDLNERHLLELEAHDAIRTYVLEDGESLGFLGGSGKDAIYVFSGEARCLVDGVEQRLQWSRKSGCFPLDIRASQQVQIVALGRTRLCRADRDQLDYMIGWEAMLDNVADHVEQDIRRRLQSLRNPLVFMRLPFENVVRAFEKMQTVQVSTGEEVVIQGQPGESFYIIEQGEAEIWKSGPYDDEQQRILSLQKGDQFGEDALISGGTRNATVRMTTDGRLLSLSKTDFDELIRSHLVSEVDAGVAKAMQDSGRVMVDVRYEEEWNDAHIPQAMLLPLHDLRQRLPQLENNIQYVTYCQSGKRSAVAAMIMKQAGLDAVSLQNGIRDWPYETISAT